VAAAAAAKLAFGFVIGRSQSGYSIGMCYMFGLFLVFLATFQLAYFDKILAALCETSSCFIFWVIFGHVIFPPNWWKRTSLNITGWFKNFTDNVLVLYLEFLWKSLLYYIFYRPTYYS